jgi:hypothetical protein
MRAADRRQAPRAGLALRRPAYSRLTGLSDRIEADGGTLEVTSPVGHGTRLFIEIPV